MVILLLGARRQSSSGDRGFTGRDRTISIPQDSAHLLVRTFLPCTAHLLDGTIQYRSHQTLYDLYAFSLLTFHMSLATRCISS